MVEQKITVTDAAATIRRSQNIRLYTVVVVMSVVIVTLVVMLVNGPSLTKTSKPAASYKAPITSGASRLDPKEMWAEKFATEHELQAKRITAMEKMLQTLVKINEQAVPTASTSLNQNHPQGMVPQGVVQQLRFNPNNSQANPGNFKQNPHDPVAATTDLIETLNPNSGLEVSICKS